MDNLARDVAEALRLGYGCHYGWYKIDHPCTADHSVDLKPDPESPHPTKACRQCGKLFYPENGNQVFCSDDCRINRQRQLSSESYYRRKPIAEAVCPVCGLRFLMQTRRQIYCSKTCAAVVRNKTRRKKKGDADP